jgi:hypothetical protein
MCRQNVKKHKNDGLYSVNMDRFVEDQENRKRQHYLHVEYLNAGKWENKTILKVFPKTISFNFGFTLRPRKRTLRKLLNNNFLKHCSIRLA